MREAILCLLGLVAFALPADAEFKLPPDVELRVFQGIKCGACRALLYETSRLLDEAHEKYVPVERKNDKKWLLANMPDKADRELELACKNLHSKWLYSKRGQDLIRTCIHTDVKDPTIGQRIAFSDVENGDRIFANETAEQENFARNDTRSVFNDEFRKKTFNDLCDEVANSEEFEGILKKGGRFRLKDDDNKKHCDMLRFCREPKPLSAVIGTNMPGMSGKGNSGLSTAFIQMEEHRKTGELRRQAAVEKRKMELARELGREYNPEDEDLQDDLEELYGEELRNVQPEPLPDDDRAQAAMKLQEAVSKGAVGDDGEL